MINIFTIMYNLYDNESSKLLKWDEASFMTENRSYAKFFLHKIQIKT